MAGNDLQSANLIPDAPLLNAQYRVMELLGEGGMGRVFRAEHRITGQVVAVKVLRQELLTDPSFRIRFITEAKALSRLDHPSITHLHNFIEESDGRLFLIMQFVAGQNLESLVFAVGALPPTVAVTIFLYVLRAFSYAHAQGVVHRDIKPANIVLSPGGGVKVMDFGIARIDAGSRITATGASLGSPGYMSPEQVLGRPLDHRCDIYALGVMLFEMVTGDLPYPGDNGYTVMKAHVEQPVPDPRKILTVPDKVAEAIMWAMQKNPDDRPQTVEALIEVLPTAESMGGTEDEAWRFVFGENVKPRLGTPTLSGAPPVRPHSTMGVAIPGGPIHQTVAPAQAGGAQPTQHGLPVPIPLPASPPRSSKTPAVLALVGVALASAGGIYLWKSNQAGVAAPTVQLPSALVVKGGEMVKIPADGTKEPFYLDRTEVTYRQYRAWLEACPTGSACGPSHDISTLNLPPDTLVTVVDHPVASVSHSDAVGYCRWANKRLPTSEEWTRAAAGPNASLFPWGNEAAASKAWLARTVKEGPQFFSDMKNRPGGLPTVSIHSEAYYDDESAYGVLGLGGNVSEWLSDVDADDKSLRLVAGGSWSSQNPATEARSAERSSQSSEQTSSSLGFRCALDAKEAVRLGTVDLLSQIQSNKVLRVGAEDESPPMLRKNAKGEAEGFEYELMQHIASSLGVKLEVVPGIYPDLPGKLRSAKNDVIISAYTPDDSIRGVQWSTSYLEYGLCMVVKKDSAIRRVEDLGGKKVGHYNDPATAKAVRQLVPSSAKLSSIENNYLEAVKTGQIDAMLYDFPFMSEEIKSYEADLRISQFGLTEATYNAGVKEGEFSLMRAVNRAIWSLRSSEKYAQLLRKYLSGAPVVDDIPAGARTTVVREGDTLEQVAQRELGDGKRWPEIWSLNKFRIANQNMLYVGTPLVLPAQEPPGK